MGHCMKLKYPEQLPVHDLPSSLVQAVRSYLDLTRGTQKWKEFLQAATEIGSWYSLTFQEAERESLPDKPSNLISFLDSRGLVVVELVRILDKLRVEYLQDQIRQDEPLVIDCTSGDIRIEEGKPCILKVYARGFPYPKYQWFRGEKRNQEFIHGAINNDLIIRHARTTDVDVYRCGIRRYSYEDFTYSDDIRLIVSAIETTNIQSNKNRHLPHAISFPSRCVEDSEDSTECYGYVQNDHTVSLKLNNVNVNAIADSSPCNDIDILVHPVSISVNIRDNCTFQCSARSSRQLNYQWFKDGQMISGANGTLYHIECVDANSPGKYQCKVACADTQTERLSYMADLEVKGIPPFATAYHPRDKVALLIGNYSYKACVDLGIIPRNDIKVLAERFSLLGFKVVSLLNLTKSELRNIVREFVQLLGVGVYSVFYFCGHGFDDDGTSFLIPVDAPEGFTIHDCICAKDILNEIQTALPDLAVMILDICRTKREKDLKQPVYPYRSALRQRGNSVYLYATSEGMESFQRRGDENGILVKHLIKFLDCPKPVLGVFQDVLEDFRLFPDQSLDKQIPQITTTLMEPKRSFCDDILSSGPTTTMMLRCQQWAKFTSAPLIRPVVFRNLGLRVKVKCSALFCNVLCVTWDIQPTNNHRAHRIQFIRMLDIPEMVTVRKSTTGNAIEMEDIQKIKDEFSCKLCIGYSEKDTVHLQTETEEVYFGTPLVAALKIWRREAMEQSENE